MIELTNHIQTEEASRASVEHNRLLFERNVLGVLRTGVDGSVLEVDDAFARFLGFRSREDLQDGSVKNCYYCPTDYESMLDRLLSEGGLTNHELCLRHK